MVAALLAAHPEAAKEKDEVRPAFPHTLRAVACRLCARALSLARCRAAQRERLPLHVAAAFQASEAVVAALLKAYPDAAKEKDEVRPA